MANPGDEFPAGEDYLVRRIKDLERQVSENASSIPRSFQSTIDTLNAQVAAIAAVVNSQVTGTVGHGTATGFGLNTSAQELTRATITVPAGYTRALVFGTSSMTMNLTNYPGVDFIRGYIDINGNAAPVSGGLCTVNLVTAMVTVSYSYLLTGLSGGSTFYVRAIYYNETAGSGTTSARNICNLDTIVTFLR